MIVLDTSALVAILFDEPERARFRSELDRAGGGLLSAASWVELSMVVEGRKLAAGRALVERFLAVTHIEIVAVSAAHAEIAIDAFRRYGRGQHPARLNFGDCFAYALAKAARLPLLFKGDDFAHTDIISAVPA